MVCAAEAAEAPVIYFVRAGEDGPVKIGYATDFAKRVSSLQVGNHLPLKLIRQVDGPRPAERWYHQRFSDCHIAREWFHFHLDMLEVTHPTDLGMRLDRGLSLAVSRIGFAGIAKACGIHISAVMRWTRVPVDRCVDVMNASGVPGDVLRPDIAAILRGHEAA